MLKIAIVSGKENGSPKVLGETLQKFINSTEHNAEIFFEAKAFRRLLPAKATGKNVILWKVYKLWYYFRDRKLYDKLKRKDAIVICDWTPHGFYNDSYNIEKLKSIIKKPILYYSVQYLGNSPTIIEKLKSDGHALFERYDWHLAVSEVTEIRGIPSPPWSQIGMYLKGSGLKPSIKKEFLALVDFLRPGYEKYRLEQIRVLEELDIPYISLEGEYTLEDIRKLYQQASIYFIQFPEAYGLPIAENLAYGAYIGTPDSSWAMSWRLSKSVKIHGPGTLANCFLVYDGVYDLKAKIKALRDVYDKENTPKQVFKSFIENYPSFYEGNREALYEVLERIKSNHIKS